ncbi:hypothetical protein U9M48_006205 [Paspalum notatum var. saurae]|uniref:DUF4005 domain-containing protein n=1 Tax=Paspalum notatum var. saurae TaxID=547442 RepID=A0AAQ3SM51_PASNO
MIDVDGPVPSRPDTVPIMLPHSRIKKILTPKIIHGRAGRHPCSRPPASRGRPSDELSRSVARGGWPRRRRIRLGMGKAGRWLKSFLSSGKKDSRPPPQAEAAAPKDKRWSFRRPGQEGKAAVATAGGGLGGAPDAEFDRQEKRAVAVAAATAAAADAAVAAAQAAAAARLSSRRAHAPPGLGEDAAAVRIQATFRGYLARTALCALRGIVKLQALVRGQLVRKQASATLRCMQALLTAQSHLRARRMLALHQVQDHHHHHHPPPPRPRHSPQHPRHRRSYEMDRSCEEHAKIVEMDIGEPLVRRKDGPFPAESHSHHHHGRCSPAPSAVTEMSPRAYSGHFDELSLGTAQSSPRGEACPGYMANTESSRAKARSQSAPRQRTDALERQPSRRKGTPPRAAKMQRSSSLASAGAGAGAGHSASWSAGVRLDVSSASLRDSECGSTSSVLTAATVYSRTRSLVGFEVRRKCAVGCTEFLSPGVCHWCQLQFFRWFQIGSFEQSKCL